MDLLARLSLDAASIITGKKDTNEETQKVAFHLACVAMAEEKAGK